jgi:apolipoprotein D and lipocalin family protein
MRFLFFIPLLSILGCKPDQPLETVANVDKKRYMGTWYEIARLPNRFENGLKNITANYSLRKDGKITVINKGQKDDGSISDVEGIAYIPNTNEKSKLKVSFFRPFYGKYWIIELDEVNHQYALVGHPNREYLWILSRTPQISQELFEQLISAAKIKGFDVSQLVMVVHN